MERDYSGYIYKIFKSGMSINELHKFKYGKNKSLNHLIDRIPAYIKYVKDMEKYEDIGGNNSLKTINNHAGDAA